MKAVVKSSLNSSLFNKISSVVKEIEFKTAVERIQPDGEIVLEPMVADCYGALLHGEMCDNYAWGIGVSGAGNSVEFRASDDELTIWINSTRSALQNGGNCAGELFLRLTSVIDPATMTLVEYSSHEYSELYKKFWYLPGRAIKWHNSGAHDLIDVINQDPSLRPKAKIVGSPEYPSVQLTENESEWSARMVKSFGKKWTNIRKKVGRSALFNAAYPRYAEELN